MFHKLHRGASLPSVIAGGDYCFEHDGKKCFDDVIFPQDIRNCSNCHNENDPETPQAANWYKVPTAEACGSCHDDVNFETGAGHAAGPRDNSTCTTCHKPDTTSSLGAYQKHRILTQEGADRYSFNILSVAFTVPGTAPVVTFSVTDPTNNDAPYNLATDPDIAAGKPLFYQAWVTTDYTNPGNKNSAATATNIYSGGVLQATDNGNFTYTLTLGVIPSGTTGSGIVTFAGKVTSAVGDLPVTSTHRFYGITDDGFYPVTIDSGVLSTSINRGVDDTDPTDNNRISPNSATCSVCHSSSSAQVHMEQNGGSFDVCQESDGTMRVRVNFCGPGGDKGGAIVQEGCTTCHAKGRIADVAVTHSLNLN